MSKTSPSPSPSDHHHHQHHQFVFIAVRILIIIIIISSLISVWHSTIYVPPLSHETQRSNLHLKQTYLCKFAAAAAETLLPQLLHVHPAAASYSFVDNSKRWPREQRTPETNCILPTRIFHSSFISDYHRTIAQSARINLMVSTRKTTVHGPSQQSIVKDRRSLCGLGR